MKKRKPFYFLRRQFHVFYKRSIRCQRKDALKSAACLTHAIRFLYQWNEIRIEDVQKKLRKLNRKKTTSLRRQKKVQRLVEFKRKALIDQADLVLLQERWFMEFHIRSVYQRLLEESNITQNE